MATKQRLELKSNAAQTPATLLAANTPGAPVEVVAKASGPVSLLDKLKGYYKAVIAVVGALLIVLNELSPISDFLPTSARHWLTVGIAVLTAASNVLVKNQHWVDDL